MDPKHKSLPLALATAKLSRKKKLAAPPGTADGCPACAMAEGGMCMAHGGAVTGSPTEDTAMNAVDRGPKAGRKGVVDEILMDRAGMADGGMVESEETNSWEEAPVNDFREHPNQPEVSDPEHDAGSTDDELDEGIVGQILNDRKRNRR
jgi:hypothetical protein